MARRGVVVRLGLLLAGLLAGCSDISPSSTARSPSPADTESRAAPGSGDQKPYRIVATTGIVAEAVSRIAADRATVQSLMGPGADPHLYRPTRNDVRRMLDADMIVYSGLNLEHRMQDSIEQLARSGKRTLAITAGLAPDRLRQLPDALGQYDPHVWMDPALWADCVRHLGKTLIEYDPAGADGYRERTEAFCREIAELDAYITGIMPTIPDKQRVLVTGHDAFGYFGARYQLELHSVQGVSTESEAGVQDVNALVDLIVTRHLPAIFMESSLGPKSLQAVREGCQSRGEHVVLGATLYSDALGPSDTYEGTYLGMLDANATHIVRALGGTAPERGWRGQLTIP